VTHRAAALLPGRSGVTLCRADFRPRALRRPGLARRLAPFAAPPLALAGGNVLILGWVHEKTTPALVALGLTVVIIAAAFLLPWHRWPELMESAFPLGFIAVAILLGHVPASHGEVFSILLALPVVWVALYSSRPTMLTVLTAVVVTPGLDALGSGSDAAIWEGLLTRGLTLPTLACCVHELADRLRGHVTVHQAVARVAQAVAITDDGREDVCEALRDLTGADLVVLAEPAESGGLEATVCSGTARPVSALEPLEAPPAPMLIEVTRERARESGLRSAYVVPLRGPHGHCAGAVSLGWRRDVVALDPHLTTLVQTIATEAALAIGQTRLRTQLRELAGTDGLTGLPNRRTWDQALDRAIAAARRAGTELSLAILDLDEFKGYNDAHGHQTGDRLLADASRAWRSALRGEDFIARYGGEEFAVLLQGLEPVAAACVIERLRSATPHAVTCSAGIAAWNGLESTQDLVSRADRALYQAKCRGRDRLALADPPEQPAFAA
jgi:diguanylate cyclase (GGDEF)-like protein